MLIRPKKPAEEILTGERCYIREVLNDPAVPEVSLAEARVAPGVTTELHRLSVAEWYIIRQGEGLMDPGDGEPFEVRPGDIVAISPQKPQRITNTGSADLKFLCLCLPAFRPECYEGLEPDGD